MPASTDERLLSGSEKRGDESFFLGAEVPSKERTHFLGCIK